MSTTLYQIEIRDLFNGPIDLLLYLVRKQEVNVAEVRIGEIVDRFLEYLNVLEFIDFDLAADFVVAAAALVEVKSHLALVRDEDQEEEQEEPVEETSTSQLVSHLLAYKNLRDAAELLQEQALAWQDRYPRLADERPQSKRSLADDVLKDLEVWDLVGAFARIVRQKSDERESLIRFDETPIHIYVDQIGAQVRAEGRVRFQNLFDSTDDRSKVIGMFLAVLELLRHHGFRACQETDFAEIWILPPVENEQSEDETLPERD